MAVLTFIEKRTICRLFGIEGGYVFSYWQNKDYNKNTTRELLLDACGIDIYNDKDYQGLSQQKCIEKIWQDCSPQIVAKLLDALCDYFEFRMGTDRWSDEDYQDYHEVQEISRRLQSIDSIELPQREQSNLLLIVRDIEANIDIGTPELAVDRLHTFATQFFRDVCKSHGILTMNDKGIYYSLEGNVARLKKWYVDNNYFESEFCVIALQNTINIFAKFNEIRNEKSAAHPNSLLAKNEAEYVVKIIADTLIFIDKIEKQKSAEMQNLPWEKDSIGANDVDDLPF